MVLQIWCVVLVFECQGFRTCVKSKDLVCKQLKKTVILINHSKQKFSLSRGLGRSPESCPCAVTSRVFVRGEPVTGETEERKESAEEISRFGTQRLLKEQSWSLCTIFGARAHAFDCCHDWIVNAELALLFSYFLFVSIKHWDQENSTEVSTPLTTGMSQKERPTFYRQELNKTIWEVPERYQNLSPVGSGAYGTVW